MNHCADDRIALLDTLCAPGVEDIGRLAAAAFAQIPDAFRNRCANLAIRVADFADTATLDEMGIEDPFTLTGLYRGIDLTRRSHGDTAAMPDEVWLYRRPILDEWAERNADTLGELVAHVLIHEIAHHFGLTDEQIAAIDDWRK